MRVNAIVNQILRYAISLNSQQQKSMNGGEVNIYYGNWELSEEKVIQ